MKKVLLVATVQSHICQFHKPLVELLHSKGYEVHVAARDNLSEKNGLSISFVDKVFDIPFSRSPINMDNIKAYKELKKVLKDEKYEVIHCNTPVGGIIGRLAAISNRKKGVKIFYTAHGFHFYKGAPVLNWCVYYPIERFFSRFTDKLITIVGEDYNFAKMHFKCPVYRIHGTGVDQKRFFSVPTEEKLDLKMKMGYAKNQRIILCVGELLSNKNQQMIIKCMVELLKQVPDIKLLLAGNGPEKNELNNLITSLNLDKNVEMLDYVTDIERYLRISDLLVSCSIREGLGLNVIEAMMSGIPVVLTNNRGHRELIDHNKNGYLVEINNINQMEEAIIRILSSKEDQERMRNNGILFSNKYSFDNVKEELEVIYEL